jgi:hypothetical protein
VFVADLQHRAARGASQHPARRTRRQRTSTLAAAMSAGALYSAL